MFEIITFWISARNSVLSHFGNFLHPKQYFPGPNSPQYQTLICTQIIPIHPHRPWIAQIITTYLMTRLTACRHKLKSLKSPSSHFVNLHALLTERPSSVLLAKKSIIYPPPSSKPVIHQAKMINPAATICCGCPGSHKLCC